MKKSSKTSILITVLALLLVAAVLGYRSLSGKVTPQQSTASASEQSAPDFTVQDAGGKSISFSSFQGRPVVLNFWASWCPPCKAEMPDYEKMYQQYASKGVVFMMVNMTDGSKETVSTAQKFLKDNQYTFQAYFDVEGSASETYGISSIPDSVFINKNGEIIGAYKGMLDSATMQKNIEAILEK